MKKIRSDRSIEFPAELSAIVLMLMAPTTLSAAWMKEDNEAIDVQLRELGFSDEARTFAVDAMRRLPRPAVKVVCEQVKNVFWSGEEPHPAPLHAQRIVKLMQQLPPDVVPPK